MARLTEERYEALLTKKTHRNIEYVLTRTMKSDILKPLNPESLGITIEDHYNTLMTFLAREGGLSHFFGDNYSWVSSYPFWWPNLIFNIYFDETNKNEVLDLMAKDIEERKAPPFLLIGPRTSFTGLLEILSVRGIRHVDQWSGMAIDAENVFTDGDRLLPSLHIEIARDADVLEDWLYVVNQVLFSGRKLDSGLFLKLMNHPQIKYIVAYCEDKPVATAMNFYSQGVAGLYMVATLQSHRKKGVGSFITRECIYQAKHDGFKSCVLHSTKMGSGMYKKIGYREYCSLDVYWMMGTI